MVPDLEARLMNGSSDDMVSIAEMARHFCRVYTLYAHRFVTASERHLRRQV